MAIEVMITFDAEHSVPYHPKMRRKQFVFGNTPDECYSELAVKAINCGLFCQAQRTKPKKPRIRFLN